MLQKLNDVSVIVLDQLGQERNVYLEPIRDFQTMTAPLSNFLTYLKTSILYHY